MITGSNYMCNVHSLFVLDKEHHVSSYIAYFIAYHNIGVIGVESIKTLELQFFMCEMLQLTNVRDLDTNWAQNYKYHFSIFFLIFVWLLRLLLMCCQKSDIKLYKRYRDRQFL